MNRINMTCSSGQNQSAVLSFVSEKKRISHQTTHTATESLPAAIAPSSVKTTSNQGWFQGPPIMGLPYGKLPILFPYHSHIFRDSYGNSMGSFPFSGVPLLGVPENPIDQTQKTGPVVQPIFSHLQNRPSKSHNFTIQGTIITHQWK